jgi:hypothetical protein
MQRHQKKPLSATRPGWVRAWLFLLVSLVVSAQAFGAAHDAEHVTDHGGEPCEICLLGTGTDDAMASSGLALTLPREVVTTPAETERSPDLFFRFVFSPRAPPELTPAA